MPTENGHHIPNDSNKRRGNLSSLKQSKSKKRKPGRDGAHPPDRTGETKKGKTVPQNEPRQNQQITNPTKNKWKKYAMTVRIQEDEPEEKKSTTYKIPQTQTNKHSHQQKQNPSKKEFSRSR